MSDSMLICGHSPKKSRRKGIIKDLLENKDSQIWVEHGEEGGSTLYYNRLTNKVAKKLPENICRLCVKREPSKDHSGDWCSTGCLEDVFSATLGASNYRKVFEDYILHKKQHYSPKDQDIIERVFMCKLDRFTDFDEYVMETGLVNVVSHRKHLVALKRVFDEAMVDQMLLAHLDYKIRSALESSDRNFKSADKDLVSNYLQILEDMFERREIDTQTRFSALVKKTYGHPVMYMMLKTSYFQAKRAFEDFLDSKDRGVYKKLKTVSFSTSANEEKEEGEI